MKRNNSNKKRWPLVLFIILTILIASAVAWYFFVKKDQTDKGSEQTTGNSRQGDSDTATDTHPSRIRVVATGDVVAHDSVNANAKQSDGSYNYYPMLDAMTPVFAASNINFCNQVTLAGGTQFGVTGYPKFNAPTELVRDLGKVGCNTVNMASNHSFDKSQDAISANVAAWEKAPNTLAYAGQNRSAAERDKVSYFEQKGIKFAFLAYTTYINGDSPVQNDYGVTQYSRALANKQIAEVKANGAEIIIVSMRWGTEYSSTINAEQISEAQHLSDQGAALILGHGPHVLQPVKKITGSGGNTTYVWYSLGNFLNTQIEAEALFNGFAVIDFDTNTKQVTNVGYLPLYMHYEWSAADAASENLLARKNLKMYLLDDATDAMLATNQLKTTLAAQRQRITTVLNAYTSIPILSNDQYYQ